MRSLVPTVPRLRTGPTAEHVPWPLSILHFAVVIKQFLTGFAGASDRSGSTLCRKDRCRLHNFAKMYVLAARSVATAHYSYGARSSEVSPTWPPRLNGPINWRP